MDAQVVVRELRLEARTDSLGEATFRGMPQGVYTLEARRIGYAPLVTPVSITAHDTVEVLLLLRRPVTQLPAVEVVDTPASPFLKEFEARRAQHIGGYFITEREIRRELGSDLVAVLRKRVPGIRAELLPDRRIRVFSTRGYDSVKGAPCQVAVFLNGVRLYDGDVNVVGLEGLGGLEYYPPGYAPVQYRVSAPVEAKDRRAGGSSMCGVLLLWSRP